MTATHDVFNQSTALEEVNLFEIDLAGGRRVRVPMRFDPDILRTLVRVLDAAC